MQTNQLFKSKRQISNRKNCVVLQDNNKKLTNKHSSIASTTLHVLVQTRVVQNWPVSYDLVYASRHMTGITLQIKSKIIIWNFSYFIVQGLCKFGFNYSCHKSDCDAAISALLRRQVPNILAQPKPRKVNVGVYECDRVCNCM